jgi:hypothetical protein
MSREPDSDEQRRVLRQHLQTHRRVLISMLNPASATGGDSFPRSMTMRMLTGKSTLLMLFLAEVLPLLLARYIARSSFRAKDK